MPLFPATLSSCEYCRTAVASHLPAVARQLKAMANSSSQRIALLLNQEIAAVVTAMRQNAKWAMVPTRYTVSLERPNECLSMASLDNLY